MPHTRIVARILLSSGALICLAAASLTAASCSSEPSQSNNAGGNSQSGGSVAQGGGGMAGSGVAGGVSGGSSGSANAGTTSAGTMSGGGVGGMGGAAAGSAGAASGAGGMSGGNGGTGGSGPVNRKGKSVGCGKDANGAVSNTFTNHTISLPACAACTPPDCPRNCVAPPWVPGGVNAVTAPNGENYLNRDYTIEIPQNYDPMQAYPVFFGADGCGPAPPQHGAGFSVPGEDGAIKIGLQQIGQCFADGGIRCAPDIKNVGLCTNGPEIPYFLAVQKWVEDNFCVDLGKQFIGGGSSGAWEAILAGCAAADTVRGFYSVAGGLREHRWACNGPVAAFMIASNTDQANPVGPLATLNVPEDTFGMAPARDEILKRNGCAGSASAPYDAKYPECVKYTACPAEYPVIWCNFPGGSHDNPNYNNVNYANAVAPFLLGLPPEP
jgi:hypothetical protein